eukprot:scaffold417_cov252-Pinguiococcus_pyrenoidosus.AAC.2
MRLESAMQAFRPKVSARNPPRGAPGRWPSGDMAATSPLLHGDSAKVLSSDGRAPLMTPRS